MRRFALVMYCLVLAACVNPRRDLDAGLADASTADGAVDAGLPDASIDSGFDGGDSGIEDAGTTDAGATGDAGVDAGLSDAGDLVTVTSERELRGVWVASVANLDWPTAQGQTADAGRASLELLVGRLADAGFNAIFFQVRPESDALYDSTVEPWSRYLTGTQGRDPGWDPLETLLDAAHARGIEVHAWLNPFRALSNVGASTAANHVSRTLAPYAVTYNGQLVMNPGAAPVREHVIDVVKDLLERYDVDGLHFDDYFYPYPDSSQTPFPDDSLYQAYTTQGGTLSRPDWRRENVNSLVREVMHVITSEHPQVRFGVSPFGIYKSGVPSGISGLSAYSEIFCDAPKWMTQGWVDYLAPQLYWPTTQTAQAYTTLATWWAGGSTGGRHIFPGHATYQLATSSAWSLAEYRTQLSVTRSLRGSGARGDLHFRAAHVLANRAGLFDALSQSEYAKPALVPELPRAGASIAPAVPTVGLSGTTLTVQSQLPMSVRFFALYRETAGAFELVKVVGPSGPTFEVSSGTWVVTAVGRGGAESRGVRVTVP